MNVSKKTLVWITLLIISLFSSLIIEFETVFASSSDTDVNIYLFWGEGCPYCAEAKPVLEEIADADDRIGYYDFEVYENEENLALFFEMSEAYGVAPGGVPAIFVGEQYWIGYSDSLKTEIEDYIDYCLENECDDIGRALLEPSNPVQTVTPQEAITVTEEATLEVGITPTPTDDNSGDQNGETIPLDNEFEPEEEEPHRQLREPSRWLGILIIVGAVLAILILIIVIVKKRKTAPVNDYSDDDFFNF